LHQLRESLVELLAHLEAGLDFADEDIQFIAAEQIQLQLDDAARLVAVAAAQLSSRARHEALPSVVLVGRPNTGKSSLFNALAGDGRALVADRPGTTRDYLAAVVDLDGVGCRLVDTAGHERLEPADESPGTGIAHAAQDLAGNQTRDCDVVALCLDSTRPLNEWERSEMVAKGTQPRLIILTKHDGPRGIEPLGSAIETSAKTGLGLQALRAALRHTLATLDRDDAGRMSADRAATSLQAAGEALGRAAEMNGTAWGQELIAGELRAALDELGRVVGAVYTDDILDRIFSRFCIGK
jgi:tRNA modification GTPase